MTADPQAQARRFGLRDNDLAILSQPNLFWADGSSSSQVSSVTFDLLLWLENPFAHRQPLHRMWLAFQSHEHVFEQKFYKNLFLRNALYVLTSASLAQEEEEEQGDWKESSRREQINRLLQVVYGWMTAVEHDQPPPTTRLCVGDELLDRVREMLAVRSARNNGRGLIGPPITALHLRICKELEIKLVRMTTARAQEQLRVQRLSLEQRARDLQLKEMVRQREVHQGYPLPHPELGRPRLGMLTCLYPGCGRLFASGLELDNHLRAEKQADYIPRMHRMHHDVAINNGLTPSWVRKNKLVRCPSMACSEHGRLFATPDDLIYHLAQLGIESFWSPDWRPRALEVVEQKKSQDAAAAAAAAPNAIQESKANDNATLVVHVREHFNVVRDDEGALPQCICCFDGDADIIALPCSHQVLCQSCFFKIKSPECTICRARIDLIIFSMF